MQALWDIPQVMMQAHAWPMTPSLGVEWVIPGPATQDGIITTPYDKAKADVRRAACAGYGSGLEALAAGHCGHANGTLLASQNALVWSGRYRHDPGGSPASRVGTKFLF